MNNLLRIAITGPESTGKSMLAEQLALHYSTVWVPEHARRYIDLLDRPYLEADILEIAKGQVNDEDVMATQAKRVLFCDTELTVTKIWSEVKYKRCHPELLKLLDQYNYDLYLLCDIDLPWAEDPQREHPNMREFLFGLYQNELDGRKVNFYIISGTGRSRLENAIKIIDECFPFLKVN